MCPIHQKSKNKNIDSSSQQIRICPKCSKTFPATLEYFSRNRSNQNGLDSYCKKCKRKYQKRYNKSNLQFRSVSIKSDLDKGFEKVKGINVIGNGDWKENPVIQKFRKMYLEDLMPKNQIWRKTRLSMGNIEFLAEELGIKLSTKERNKLKIEKETEYYKRLRPSKKEIEKYYQEVNFSVGRVKSQFFPKVPYKHVIQWFNDLKITRQSPIRYINKEDRIQKIIGQLKSKLRIY